MGFCFELTLSQFAQLYETLSQFERLSVRLDRLLARVEADSDLRIGRQRNVLLDRETGLSLETRPSRSSAHLAVVDDVVLTLDRRKDRLSVHGNVNRRLVLAEEGKTDFVEARLHSQEGCLVALQNEVLRARVGTLGLPQNLAHFVLDRPALPLPAGEAGLLAKHLVDDSLLFSLLKVDLSVHFGFRSQR